MMGTVQVQGFPAREMRKTAFSF
uniref:Uncharacterized protein n=1 Tax=Synechococcus sp. (strain ATCC 27144 / PCC 6301 / SAUG 1402/1) TaxID=269084 RepID=Q53309_SYNP6|nr:hypothetical 2.5K protein (cpcB1 5'region) - Synechococcus sp [Synechococcus sp.]AAB26252.1 unknown [Synechococcus elongatus PCC 6301]